MVIALLAAAALATARPSPPPKPLLSWSATDRTLSCVGGARVTVPDGVAVTTSGENATISAGPHSVLLVRATRGPLHFGDAFDDWARAQSLVGAPIGANLSVSMHTVDGGPRTHLVYDLSTNGAPAGRWALVYLVQARHGVACRFLGLRPADGAEIQSADPIAAIDRIEIAASPGDDNPLANALLHAGGAELQLTLPSR